MNTVARTMLVLTLSLTLTGCLKHELQTGLSEPQAQEIIVLLKRHNIEAVKSRVVRDQKESWDVYLRGGEQNLFTAWRILQENGLPREKPQGLAQVFSDTGLIPTASQEKAKLILGLSGELSSTLESLPGVVDARVHIVLPENSPLLEAADRHPTTASALIKYQGENFPIQESEVKDLLSRGVEGLQSEQVVVVFKQVETLPVTTEELGSALGYQEVTLVSLALLVVVVGGSTLLMLENRRQRGKLARLQEQLAEVRPNRELTVSSE